MSPKLERLDGATPEKPRGKCTGCAFEYQLGTARTGEHKGKLVIRKHNSRTGPGLCSGAQEPPYDEQDCACGGAGVDDGCPNCSVAEEPHTEGCTPEARFGPAVCTACDEFRRWADTQTASKTVAGHCVPGRCEGCCGCSSMCTTDPCGQPAENVVGVAPGGAPIVADPFTAPLSVAEGDVSDSATLGPWVTAAFDGDCDGTACGVSFLEGMEIRADGEGGWLCESCGDENTTTREVLELVQRTLPPHTVLAPDAQVTVTYPVMPPVSISEVHAENPPRQSPPFTAPAPASDIPESSTTVSGQPEPDRDRWGRYLILGTAHTRATTFAKLGANTKAIEAWNERNVIRGLTLRPDLLMLANGLEVKRDRNDLNSIAAQAKDAAGSKVAANIGTAYHAFSERIDAHLMTLPEVPQQYQGRVFQYIDALARAGLTTRPEWIERTTAVRADQVGAPLPVAGTLDRIFQLPDGSLVIGDLKTGSDLSYGEMEIEVQLALYAHGVNTHGLFDWNTKTWHSVQGPGYVPAGPGMKVRTDIAIVVHLPADGDGCTLYVADIERGWMDAQRLGPLQSSLKEKKRFRTLMLTDLHGPVPAPEPGTDLHRVLHPAAPVGRDEVAEYLAAPAVAVPEEEPYRWARAGAATEYPARPAEPSPDAVHANDQWEHAKHLFSTAPDQATVAQLYQYAMDSGKFHVDQLAVLVGIGKDRLNALARV